MQNVVLPVPSSPASEHAGSVHVFLGSQSDLGSPLDEVNQLLQKADSIQKGLAASQLPLYAPPGAWRHSRRTRRFL